MQKLLTFFSKKFQHICISLDLNFNESLTNDDVSFEQLGPDIIHHLYVWLKFSDCYTGPENAVVKMIIWDSFCDFAPNSLVVIIGFTLLKGFK